VTVVKRSGRSSLLVRPSFLVQKSDFWQPRIKIGRYFVCMSRRLEEQRERFRSRA
jgi:hypothetical protein